MMKPPTLYLLIYEKILSSKNRSENTIPRKFLSNYILGVIHHIRKPKREKIIQELEGYGLIKQLDKARIEIVLKN